MGGPVEGWKVVEDWMFDGHASAKMRCGSSHCWALEALEMRACDAWGSLVVSIQPGIAPAVSEVRNCKEGTKHAWSVPQATIT
jgi:hypothetical protein